MVIIVECPECGGRVKIPDDVLEGEIFSCPDCGMEYEVYINNGKVVLKPAEIEGEDWGE